jgi:1-acyl-sn-glycerol-3-phosphate acyltransferase
VTAVTIQPAVIAYVAARGKKLDAEGRRSLAWYGDADLAPHIWTLLRNAPVDCCVRFGEALVFTADTDRKAIAVETERRVRGLADSFML